MAEPFTPTDGMVRDGYVAGTYEVTHRASDIEQAGAEWDRWVVEHDERVMEQAATLLEQWAEEGDGLGAVYVPLYTTHLRTQIATARAARGQEH